MPDTVQRGPFGTLLKSVRESPPKETQEQFARRFFVKRSLIGNLETGTPPSPEFVDRFIEMYPEREKEILAASGGAAESRRPRRKTESPIQQRINALISAGKFREANDALEYEMAHTVVTDEPKHFWIFQSLGRVRTALDDLRDGISSFHQAVRIGESMSLGDDKLTPIWEQLLVCIRRHEGITEAQDFLSDSLARHPTAAVLWYHKGVLHWCEHAYSSAYSALTTALECGYARWDVLHARGQVLAEWGNYRAAIVELDEVLDKPKDAPPIAIAYARSTRAYAIAKLGDIERALKEFKAAEKITPENAWLHYFRALCYADLEGEQAQTWQGFWDALVCHSPSLNPPKKKLAEKMMRDLGVRLKAQAKKRPAAA